MSRHLETLRTVPLFSDLSSENIGRLDTQCTWRRVAAREWIIDYQEGGTDVFFIVGGHLRVLIRSLTGQEVILSDIRDGGFFGELAAIDGLLRLSRPDPENRDRAVISPPPVHAEIAGRVAARREAVARELKALERGGLLERKRGALVICDARRLVQLIDQAVERD